MLKINPGSHEKVPGKYNVEWQPTFLSNLNFFNNFQVSHIQRLKSSLDDDWFFLHLCCSSSMYMNYRHVAGFRDNDSDL